MTLSVLSCAPVYNVCHVDFECSVVCSSLLDLLITGANTNHICPRKMMNTGNPHPPAPFSMLIMSRLLFFCFIYHFRSFFIFNIESEDCGGRCCIHMMLAELLKRLSFQCSSGDSYGCPVHDI